MVIGIIQCYFCSARRVLWCWARIPPLVPRVRTTVLATDTSIIIYKFTYVHHLALGLWSLMCKQIIETIQQNFESGNKEFEQRIWKFLFLELDMT